MKKILLVLSILLCFLMPVSADESLYAEHVNVEITVNEDNSFDITETIEIYFETPHHGIIRSIPTENTVVREDGTSNRNYAVVSEIKCNVDYSTSEEDGSLNIKMGNADEYITGKTRYVLSYHYDIGNDPLVGKDELYLNVIGSEWDYKIKTLTVTIHMPKDFDYSKLGVSHGKYGTIDYSGVNQQRIDNDIILHYDETLGPYEAFTVRLELEENYFTKKNNIVSILASIIAPLIAVFAFLKHKANYDEFGKPDPVIDVVEFYPPGDLTPPRMIKVKNGRVSSPSVNALLITLANKGYLTINENNNDFTIYLNPIDNNVVGEERQYLQGLYKYATVINGRSAVKKEDLKYAFYKTIDEIKMSVSSLVGDIYISDGYKYEGPSFATGILLIIVTFAILSIAKLNTISIRFLKYCAWYEYVAIGIVGITGLLMIIYAMSYRKRTVENNLLLGRINGFKSFLETAEKDRLEMLVEENPSYFYDILPYAYALGVSDKWISRFEDMMVAPPEWYNGNDMYHFMDNTMEEISSAATSDPNSGSSSSSGGGSSGGGSGGGGSSGW